MSVAERKDSQVYVNIIYTYIHSYVNSRTLTHYFVKVNFTFETNWFRERFMPTDLDKTG